MNIDLFIYTYIYLLIYLDVYLTNVFRRMIG
jgi:hypothetical protein